MLSDAEIDHTANQLSKFRRNDALTKILDSYSALIDDFKRLKSDYEEERDAREKYKQIAKGQERNPYVLVLIDGDGYIFQDELIRSKSEGGTRAAQALNKAVEKDLKIKGLEHCHIMVRIYANVAGLSKSLAKLGVLGNECRSLSHFIAGFNRSYGLTDFTDAGELKENADYKLRAMLRLHADNMQCKHLYFSACHDVGYLNDLTPYRGNRDKFTMVDSPGIRFHAEFRKLELGILTFPDVFRSTPVAFAHVSSAATDTKTSSATTTLRPTSAKAIPSKRSPSSTNSSEQKAEVKNKNCKHIAWGNCKYGENCRYSHPESLGQTKKKTKESQIQTKSLKVRQSDTYQSGTALIGEAVVLPKKQDIPKGHVAVNKNGHRLDPWVGPVGPEHLFRLKNRVHERKLCNINNLQGPCDKKGCQYDHEPLEAELKPALELLARSMSCPMQGRCRSEVCLYGHVCQAMACSRRGGKTFCRLPIAAHEEDFAVAWFEPAVVKSVRRQPEMTAEPKKKMGGRDEDQESTSEAESVQGTAVYDSGAEDNQEPLLVY